MSKFYILDKSTNPKIIGENYPQCVGVVDGYNNTQENKKSLYNFAHSKGKVVDSAPDLSGIKIGHKTKLTDVVSCSLGPGNDLIVSDKFLTVLQGKSYSKIQFFKCCLNKSDKKFDYNWIHFVFQLEQLVDYKNTVFSHIDDKYSQFVKRIRSYQEFERFYQNTDEFGLIKSNQVVINCKPLDFFIIGRFNQKIYVSQEMLFEIKEIGLTGIEFKPSQDIEFRF